MNIEARGPHVWRLTWYHGSDPATGKPLRQRETVEGTRKQAEAYWHQRRREIDRGTAIDPSSLTVAQLLDLWLATKADRAMSTQDSYRLQIRRHLVPALGMVAVQQLPPLAIQRAIDIWRQTPRGDGKPGMLSPRTVHLNWQILRMALAYGVKMQLVDRNVADLVEAPGVPEVEAQWWSEAEAQAFLRATMDSPWAIAWQLALLVGLRQGEIVGLQWTDIEWDRGTITVRRTIRKGRVGSPKSAKSRRELPIDAWLLDQLRTRQATSPGPWVLSTRSGKPVAARNLSRSFEQAMAQAQVRRITFHQMRHTHGSLLAADRVDPRVIADRLGHSQVAFTFKKYIHASLDTQREAASGLSGRLVPRSGSSPDLTPSTSIHPKIAPNGSIHRRRRP